MWPIDGRIPPSNQSGAGCLTDRIEIRIGTTSFVFLLQGIVAIHVRLWNYLGMNRHVINGHTCSAATATPVKMSNEAQHHSFIKCINLSFCAVLELVCLLFALINRCMIRWSEEHGHVIILLNLQPKWPSAPTDSTRTQIDACVMKKSKLFWDRHPLSD